MSQPRTSRWLAWPLLALACLASQARAAEGCSAPPMLLERFMSAACEACWTNGEDPPGAPYVLDWIVPGEHGDDAPLAAAAIADAAARAGAVPQVRTRERWHALAPAGAWTLVIEDGPAWNGYIAAQLHVARGGEGPARAAEIYIALVEQLRAGEEGSPVERALVRGVAGPMPLDADASSATHLRAFRIPHGSRAGRLTAIGWVETAGGVVLAVARVTPEACPPAR